jgi:hypothetical protein
MVLPSFSPLGYVSTIAGPEETKNQRGKCPPPDSDPLSDFALSLKKSRLPVKQNSFLPIVQDHLR